MTQKPVRRIFLQEFKNVSHAISTYEDFSLLIKHVVEATIRAFNVKGCSIMLLDEAENQLFHVRSQGVSDEYLRKGAIFVDDKYSAFVKGEPVFVADLQNDPRVHYPEAAAKEGFVSMLTVPIKSKNYVVGLIRIYHGESSNFHEDDIDSFCVMGEHLGMAIELNGMKNFLDMIKAAMESLPKRAHNR
ncbi:MAG: GAF domain-containing protein [Deltaproteobacteria bacterium]|nr:GAF domain-containing protein [Deltaproteobacteria bacterium]